MREAAGLPEANDPDPLGELDWAAIERAIGPKPRAVVEGVGRHIVRMAQDAVPATTQEEPTEGRRLLNRRSQDAVPAKTATEPFEPAGVHRLDRKTQSEEDARPP